MLCHLFSSSLGYESPRTVMLESPLNSTFAESMMHCIYIYISTYKYMFAGSWWIYVDTIW